MEQIPNLTEELQEEIVKSMKMLKKAKSNEERKTQAETLLALTQSLESLTNTLVNINDTFGGLDEDDFDLFGDEDDDEVIKF